MCNGVFFFLPACMSVWRCWIPWNRSYRELWGAMWVQRIEPGSPVRAAIVLSLWAVLGLLPWAFGSTVLPKKGICRRRPIHLVAPGKQKERKRKEGKTAPWLGVRGLLVAGWRLCSGTKSWDCVCSSSFFSSSKNSSSSTLPPLIGSRLKKKKPKQKPNQHHNPAWMWRFWRWKSPFNC